MGQVAPKFGGDASRAFAICTAALQKSGGLKKGTQKLTKKGKGNAISRGKDKKETGSKDAAYERALKASKKARDAADEAMTPRSRRAAIGGLSKITSGSLSNGAFPKPSKKKRPKTMDSYKIKIKEALELVDEAVSLPPNVLKVIQDANADLKIAGLRKFFSLYKKSDQGLAMYRSGAMKVLQDMNIAFGRRLKAGKMVTPSDVTKFLNRKATKKKIFKEHMGQLRDYGQALANKMNQDS